MISLTFVGRHARRASRNLFITTVILLAVYVLGVRFRVLAPWAINWREWGWGLWLPVGVGLFLPYLIVRNVYRIAQGFRDIHNHWVIRNLAQFGDPIRVARDIDWELHAGLHTFIGSLVMTPSWILQSDLFGLEAIPSTCIVWAYKKITKHYTNLIPTGRDFTLVARLSNKGEFEVRESEEIVDRLLTEVSQRAPWALIGYDKVLETTWQANSAKIIGDVQRRISELRPYPEIKLDEQDCSSGVSGDEQIRSTGTPGERVRRAAEVAAWKRRQMEGAAEEAQQRQESAMRELARRANEMGRKYLARAQEIRHESRFNIHLHLEYQADRPESPGPTASITIGRPRNGWRGLRITPQNLAGKWSIAIQRIEETKSAIYPDDDHLLAARDVILESLMLEAARALGAGEEEPGM